MAGGAARRPALPSGPHLTEADWRPFATFLRFDPVYFSHFACNLRRLVDHPNLRGCPRELCPWPGVAETVTGLG